MKGQQTPNFEQNLALVLGFIHEYFARPDIGADDDLIEKGILDSVRTVELVYFLEVRLGISLPSHVLNRETLKTPGSVAKMLTELPISKTNREN